MTSVSACGRASSAAAKRGRTTTATSIRACASKALAVSVAVPGPTARTIPLSSTAAISELLEVQITDLLSCAQPVYTLAATCPRTPTSSESASGKAVIARFGSTRPAHESAPPPAHPASTRLSSAASWCSFRCPRRFRTPLAERIVFIASLPLDPSECCMEADAGSTRCHGASSHGGRGADDECHASVIVRLGIVKRISCRKKSGGTASLAAPPDP